MDSSDAIPAPTQAEISQYQNLQNSLTREELRALAGETAKVNIHSNNESYYTYVEDPEYKAKESVLGRVKIGPDAPPVWLNQLNHWPLPENPLPERIDYIVISDSTLTAASAEVEGSPEAYCAVQLPWACLGLAQGPVLSIVRNGGIFGRDNSILETVKRHLACWRGRPPLGIVILTSFNDVAEYDEEAEDWWFDENEENVGIRKESVVQKSKSKNDESPVSPRTKALKSMFQYRDTEFPLETARFSNTEKAFVAADVNRMLRWTGDRWVELSLSHETMSSESENMNYMRVRTALVHGVIEKENGRSSFAHGKETQKTTSSVPIIRHPSEVLNPSRASCNESCSSSRRAEPESREKMERSESMPRLPAQMRRFRNIPPLHMPSEEDLVATAASKKQATRPTKRSSGEPSSPVDTRLVRVQKPYQKEKKLPVNTPLSPRRRLERLMQGRALTLAARNGDERFESKQPRDGMSVIEFLDACGIYESRDMESPRTSGLNWQHLPSPPGRYSSAAPSSRPIRFAEYPFLKTPPECVGESSEQRLRPKTPAEIDRDYGGVRGLKELVRYLQEKFCGDSSITDADLRMSSSEKHYLKSLEAKYRDDDAWEDDDWWYSSSRSWRDDWHAWDENEYICGDSPHCSEREAPELDGDWDGDWDYAGERDCRWYRKSEWTDWWPSKDEEWWRWGNTDFEEWGRWRNADFEEEGRVRERTPQRGRSDEKWQHWEENEDWQDASSKDASEDWQGASSKHANEAQKKFQRRLVRWQDTAQKNCKWHWNVQADSDSNFYEYSRYHYSYDERYLSSGLQEPELRPLTTMPIIVGLCNSKRCDSGYYSARFRLSDTLQRSLDHISRRYKEAFTGFTKNTIQTPNPVVVVSLKEEVDALVLSNTIAFDEGHVELQKLGGIAQLLAILVGRAEVRNRLKHLEGIQGKAWEVFEKNQGDVVYGSEKATQFKNNASYCDWASRCVNVITGQHMERLIEVFMRCAENLKEQGAIAKVVRRLVRDKVQIGESSITGCAALLRELGEGDVDLK